MGLLSAMGRGAALEGALARPITSTASHAMLGGLGGAAISGMTGGDMGQGALAGAGLGAGLGMGRAGLQAAIGGVRGAMGELPAMQLQSMKQEALQYVRNNPQATQAVMQAQTPQEISAIVEAVVTRSRSRMTEGGF